MQPWTEVEEYQEILNHQVPKEGGGLSSEGSGISIILGSSLHRQLLNIHSRISDCFLSLKII